jgi:2-oxoglutarate ferredoxin oxidoreductase subunit alpha
MSPSQDSDLFPLRSLISHQLEHGGMLISLGSEEPHTIIYISQLKLSSPLGYLLIESRNISFLIGGEAGAGISAAGSLLGMTLLRHGFYVFGTIDYPSLIRGGHNFYSLRVSSEPVYSQWHTYDVVVALDSKTIGHHMSEIASGGALVYDGDLVSDKETASLSHVTLFPIPLTSIAKQLEGLSVLRNTVALGASAFVLGMRLDMLQDGIRDSFKSKGNQVVDQNEKAAQLGFEYAKDEHKDREIQSLAEQPPHEKPRLFLTGNEAIGAIASGCKFYSAYPMTPATGLLHFMVSQSERFGIVVIQAESEIAAVNMCAGAAYAGVRTMTATSGGGFSLMTEGLGMIGMTELPVVIMLGQRYGPSTGMPTYTSQSDLRFAIHASQGEFPRLVVAPGDIQECFRVTVDAFNLADKFQIPAIIMTDKHLLESHHWAEPFPLDDVHIDRGKMVSTGPYQGEMPSKRYELTSDGISPRVLPGTAGTTVHSDSAEHSETGFFAQTAENAAAMTDKRFQKLTELEKYVKSLEPVKMHGPRRSNVAIVGWGSTKGAILDAQRILKRRKVNVGFLQILCLHPFPSIAVKKAIRDKSLILVEANRTAQLGGLVKEQVGIEFQHEILRYDGRPFSPLPLADQILEVI